MGVSSSSHLTKSSTMSKLKRSATHHIFDRSEYESENETVDDIVARLDPHNYNNCRKAVINMSMGRAQSCVFTHSPEFERKFEKTAEVEIFGVKQPKLGPFVLTATHKLLSGMVSDGFKSPKPIYFRRISKSTEEFDDNSNTLMTDLGGQKSAKKAGRFQVTTVRRPTILFASGDGVGQMRSLWEEITDFNKLGLITLIFNVAKRSEIHFSHELTELLVAGYISDLIFIFGEPQKSVKQISPDNQVMKLITEKLEKGGHVYVAGIPLFTAEVKQFIAEVTDISTKVIQEQDWYHDLSDDGHDLLN